MNPIAEKVLASDARTVARLLRGVDDGWPGVTEILKDLYPYTGRSRVIGVTGAPGTGKSTLIDRMVSFLRHRDQTVGVLAVDPTSPLSGGAILGDRVRMSRHCLDPGVIIRSLATRGNFGGLTRSTLSAIDVLDAMGKNYVIVETVGVGQAEVNVTMGVHTTVIVVNPGMGDGIQALKGGLLEVGDIYVVNKADREGVELAVSDLKLMIDMDYARHQEKGWTPPIVKTQALFNEGTTELFEWIDSYMDYILRRDNGLNLRWKKERVRHELMEMVKECLAEKIIDGIMEDGTFDREVGAIMKGDTNPYEAAENLIRERFGPKAGI
jgi:GTPase